MVTEGRKATYIEMVRLRHEQWVSFGYEYIFYNEYDFTKLSRYILVGKQFINRKDNPVIRTYNDIILMADTETSKSADQDVIDNHIVCWTLSARAYGCNLFTLYGRTPSEFIDCLGRMLSALPAEYTLLYFHNLSYDYVFLRKFLFDAFGYPERALNTKPHYPVSLEFANGLIIRDSLILAQRSLERWSKDLNVEHQKAVGYWDYDRIRNQNTPLSEEELIYIEHDTLAGVECLDALRMQLNKQIWQMPYTATGIVREDVRKIGKKNRAKDAFLAAAPDLEFYKHLVWAYHGGFTHANRHELNFVNNATCYDFASEYPFVMLSEKYPAERFMRIPDTTPERILEQAADYAFLFKLVMVRPEIIDNDVVMPALQFSKSIIKINAITDNGRILKADYVEIYITEQDLAVIYEQYNAAKMYCVDVWTAEKDYLPRWLTDYIYMLFADKTMLKGGDPVAYALAKSKLNSVYGLTVQKWLRDDIQEDYTTGEYELKHTDENEEFERFINNKNNILLYQIGVWVTAYAFRNIFDLGKCIDDGSQWLYTDTDSCYSTGWNETMLTAFNDRCKDKLLANGYGPVQHNGREYWPGVAELDGIYSEFVSCGAKRYACREAESGQLKITVAGVPKKTGAACLKDDIKNFKRGFVFDGITTGKLTHTYNFIDEIYIDGYGNQIGDSINLTPCDYRLDSVYDINWDNIDYTDNFIQVYE